MRSFTEQTASPAESLAIAEHGEPPPYLDVCIAGGTAGSIADFMMHSVDTVKTRLQGQSVTVPLKYQSMVQAYRLVWREEGIIRGLYSGIIPAISGSIPATTIYFGTYEFVKRSLTRAGLPDTLSHLAAGSVGDLMASFVYVPSEVLKTRMQLQGRYNNPHFISGYNYRNTWHAAKMIVQYDGWGALYHGYGATILRDVPFSALQFAFYEKFKALAIKYHETRNLPLTTDIITGAIAGGLAGGITTPLDVIKTVLQTQVKKPTHLTNNHQTITHHYSTGIVDGLSYLYRHEGLRGLFRGVGPRVFWTSLQSAIMFVIYEQVLLIFDHGRLGGWWSPSWIGEWGWAK
ncbi:uncharacterized protein VTP21DRAFT_6153 [Calcarisporiella thermophila]|uniref:uncharacterized protein n=1 Tax=Calcarisporiella thermophila TaxID=911321 RepID=UPI0037423796